MDGGVEIMVRARDQDTVVNLMGLRMTNTIFDIKTKIQDREFIPRSLQRLSFRGQQLDDGRTLLDCNIHRADVLILDVPFGCGFGGLPYKVSVRLRKYLSNYHPTYFLI